VSEDPRYRFDKGDEVAVFGYDGVHVVIRRKAGGLDGDIPGYICETPKGRQYWYPDTEIARAAPAPAVEHTVTHVWKLGEARCTIDADGVYRAHVENEIGAMILHGANMTRGQMAALRDVLTAALEGGE
jgi:hypothetical protein